MIENRVSYKYAKDVLDGKIVACTYVKKACERFFSDLKNPDYYFNEEAADKFLKFCSILKLNTGKFAGVPFKPLPWQHFLFDNVYGFYRVKNNKRKYNTAYVLIARKNTKSTTIAAMLLYGLLEQQCAQVIVGANSKEQAAITFKQATLLAKSIDPNGKFFTYQRDRILFKQTDSFLRTISADTTKADGYNISVGAVDEIEEAVDSKMYDIMVSSQGMQENPLMLLIGTAGFDKSYYGYQRYQLATEILMGLKDVDSQFILLYTLDDGDDWADENVWIKANPCLDITVTRDYLKTQVENAKSIPSEEVGVKTKNLNVYCDSSNVWIPDHYLIECSKDINLDDFINKDCYIGVDLGATSDLTAVSFLIVDEDKYYFKTHYYLPESALYEKADKELYKQWKKEGYLTVTQGNVTDYDYITNDIMKYFQKLIIKRISYDPYNATQWAIDCTQKGLPLQPYAQNLGNFNKPTKEIERLIMGKKAIIDNNPINRFCFSNVEIKSDHNGNFKPSKSIDKKKIDGVIAMIEALGGWLSVAHYSNEILTI